MTVVPISKRARCRLAGVGRTPSATCGPPTHSSLDGSARNAKPTSMSNATDDATISCRDGGMSTTGAGGSAPTSAARCVRNTSATRSAATWGRSSRGTPPIRSITVCAASPRPSVMKSSYASALSVHRAARSTTRRSAWMAEVSADGS